jgi:hypothetical protein
VKKEDIVKKMPDKRSEIKELFTPWWREWM